MQPPGGFPPVQGKECGAGDRFLQVRRAPSERSCLGGTSTTLFTCHHHHRSNFPRRIFIIMSTFSSPAGSVFPQTPRYVRHNACSVFACGTSLNSKAMRENPSLKLWAFIFHGALGELPLNRMLAECVLPENNQRVNLRIPLNAAAMAIPWSRNVLLGRCTWHGRRHTDAQNRATNITLFALMGTVIYTVWANVSPNPLALERDKSSK